VSHPSAGIYCIGGLAFTPNNAVTTIGSDGGAVGDFLELGPNLVGNAVCPAGTQISIETFSITMDTTNGSVSSFDPVDNGFYINVN
jgi:hypothetical protein